MAHLVAAMDALRARINTVWPETAPNGILHVMVAARRTLDNRVGEGDLPFVAFDWQTGGPAPEAPMDAGADGDVVIINYVAKDSVDLETLIAKIEALRDSLWAERSLGAGGAQVVEYPRVDFGTGLFLNRYFVSTQRPYLAGGLAVRIDSGEIP